MTSTSSRNDYTNSVRLRGRLAQTVQTRDLPSGDLLLTFSLIVARPPGGGQRVDSIECATIRPRVRRTIETSQAGSWLEIEGSLHRRFWRTGAGAASRYAVDIASVRRVGRSAGAPRGQRQASA